MQAGGGTLHLHHPSPLEDGWLVLPSVNSATRPNWPLWLPMAGCSGSAAIWGIHLGGQLGWVTCLWTLPGTAGLDGLSFLQPPSSQCKPSRTQCTRHYKTGTVVALQQACSLHPLIDALESLEDTEPCAQPVSGIDI
jgi:hypothetical protein